MTSRAAKKQSPATARPAASATRPRTRQAFRAQAIAHTVGWITLFNLTPVWQLDGSRGFHALSRTQRWLMVVVIAAVWAVSRERLLVLVGLAAGWKAFEKQPQQPNDWRVFAHYSAVLAIAAALTLLRSR